jgi:tRNA pseudouridine55 synthase
MSNKPDYTGLLLIDKVSGPTSHDVVATLRRLLGVRRIGHCGTLDPLATGLMILCVGAYTRLNPWLSATDKEYVATLVFGATSNTGDAEGQIEPRSTPPIPSAADIDKVLCQFEGKIEQVPPAFSAIKVGGVRSHKLARAGKQPELKARKVRIDKIELISYAYPSLQIRVRCSKGTYIRSLAMDIGDLLGCGAYLGSLRRTAIGSMSIDNALGLDDIQGHIDAKTLDDQFLDPRFALPDLQHVRLSSEGLVRFGHGNRIDLTGVAGEYAVYSEEGDLCGIGRCEDEQLQPTIVLRQPEQGCSQV